nr:helix-turn-helix transcriptional regulator [Anaerobacillus isosaccharinicus]QOY38455.1 helix-turn-helix transcriptional regulator [Anaerobacillus isosaccharinicus]
MLKERLKELRRKNNLTQEEVAKKIGIPRSVNGHIIPDSHFHFNPGENLK